MDIPAISMSLSTAKVQQQAGISVMKMAMNSSKANVEAFSEMVKKAMENSVQPHLGNKIDISG
jgi:hypothetical protein